MNESLPETMAAPAPSYKDRATGLTVFGVMTALLGCLCALMVMLLLFGQAAAARANPAAANIGSLVPGILMYVLLAVGLVWLGIGSIQARRWARALLLIFSWSWLVMGIISLVMVALVLPGILANVFAHPAPGQPAMPQGAATAAMVVAFLVVGFFFILLPAVWVFFYGSRHVKATCEARDPVARWTDACPLPVLAMSLWLWLAVPMMLLMPVTAHGVMPFFGMFVTGLPGFVLCVVIAVVWAWSAWRLYKMDVRGWWVILIAMIVFTVSATLTYAHHDAIEMYRLMGYPEAQIEQIQQTGMLTGHRMEWFMMICMMPFLVYLLFIKKYLGGTR